MAHIRQSRQDTSRLATFAGARRGTNLIGVKDFPTGKGSSQRHNLALTGSFVPTSLESVTGSVVSGQNQYFTEMCSGSEAGSYSRLIDFVYHSTLRLRVIKRKEHAPGATRGWGFQVCQVSPLLATLSPSLPFRSGGGWGEGLQRPVSTGSHISPTRRTYPESYITNKSPDCGERQCKPRTAIEKDGLFPL